MAVGGVAELHRAAEACGEGGCPRDTHSPPRVSGTPRTAWFTGTRVLPAAVRERFKAAVQETFTS
ncbi:hypothetical protein ACWDRB_32310 [Nonomuraea sp. NPDC003707]